MNKIDPAKLPYDALQVFSVAARLENFSAAARELGVTQAAISRRIIGLERSLGFELFARMRKRVILTPRGQILLEKVTASLDFLSDSIAQLTSADLVETIVVSAPTSITYFWLEPKLRDFCRLNPSYTVRLQGTDDLYHSASSDDSIAVLAGDGQHPHWSLQRLFDEQLVPVAAPRYLASIGLPPGQQDLEPAFIAGLSLVGYGRLNTLWHTLEDWFKPRGVDPERLRFPILHSAYPTAVNAALEGEGVVLGSRNLLSKHLDSGALVEISQSVDVTGMSYFVGTPKSGRITVAAQRLADWLVSAAAS